MRILAVDTATEVCGVAVWEDDRVVAKMCADQGATHTRVLMESIRSVLDTCGLNPADLDAFVTTRGPGSFTGLRIGISTVKGLAAALSKPLVGVSTLAVLAHQAPAGTPHVCPMIDARRHEVYWSVYRRNDTGLVPVEPERAGTLDDVRLGGQGECLFIGNGAGLYAQALQERWPQRARLADAGLHALQPGVLASLGAQRYLAGDIEAAHGFSPVYLRKSDAELALAAQGKS
jgi:tRNA threonylcarbamoyladenosine biosynthesis protein TsaB